MGIRPVVPADIPDILEFWNPLIAETTVTFAPQPHTEASLGALIEGRARAGLPFFVFTDADGRAVGFANYRQFREGGGYVHAMEHTIILGPSARGMGAGRALMSALEARARDTGVHLLVAGVSAENTAGIAFHAAIGFAQAGRIRDAGFKFGRWIDLVLMQKLL